jgi:aminodeoxyfutalosine deaminase
MAGTSRARLISLPKVELHVHLEGTISAATASGLARSHKEDPSSVLVLDGDGYPDPFRDFEHFVAAFLATAAQVRTPGDLRTVSAAFAASQAAQQVRWTEATFTAVTMAARGWDPDAMWEALAEGFATQSDALIGLILDTPRDLGPDAARASVELAADAIEAGLQVVALGLTGIEGSVPEHEFAFLREAADDLDIGLVVHAGETGTPDNVRAALDDLGADRIGHGIATIHDPELLDRIAEEGVLLELCPSSNVMLGLVASLESHPIRMLRDAGVSFTVNSDDPPFFSTTLTDELAHAQRLLGLDDTGLAELQRLALDESYAPREVYEDIEAAIDGWLDPRP